MEAFRAVFPEGLSTLVQADPDVYAIIKDEEERQWCVTHIKLLLSASLRPTNYQITALQRYPRRPPVQPAKVHDHDSRI